MREKFEIIAGQFYQSIITAKKNGEFDYRDRMSRFPNGCCDDTVDLFSHHLYHKYGIISTRVDGVYHNENQENSYWHSWQEIGGIVIDLTGSQFKYESALLNYSIEPYVGPVDSFHGMFEVKKSQSRGIEELGYDCQERMYGLYQIVNRYYSLL